MGFFTCSRGTVIYRYRTTLKGYTCIRKITSRFIVVLYKLGLSSVTVLEANLYISTFLNVLFLNILIVKHL